MRLRERSAVEALRAGVPNRAAIRLLGTNETELRERFLESLRACRTALAAGAQPEGLLVQGRFGTGKSHLLGYLQELALQERFVVSLVPISKETPLFDPAKVYAAAIRNAVVPNRNDDVMTAVMSQLGTHTEAFDELEQWASSPESGLAPLFAALLNLIPRQSAAPENLATIARFFGGARLGLAPVQQWLRAAGTSKLFEVKSVKEADLALQRLRFAPRLFAAAGYSGWCVLLDEAELIGRYSVLQRGRSYAELCRWLGLDRWARLPGVVSVCAFSEDFRDFMDKKRDDEVVPQRLEAKGLEHVARLAETGIRAIERNRNSLRPLDENVLQQTLERVAQLYADAYGWRPDELLVGERLANKTMRQYIKSWITSWDIARLYHETPELDSEGLAPNYSEEKAMEQTSEEPDEIEAQ